VAEQQQEDLVMLAQTVLTCACRSFVTPQTFHACLASVATLYSPELVHTLEAIVFKQEPFTTVHGLCASLSGRAMDEVVI
jgi:hypothetical protein